MRDRSLVTFGCANRSQLSVRNHDAVTMTRHLNRTINARTAPVILVVVSGASFERPADAQQGNRPVAMRGRSMPSLTPSKLDLTELMPADLPALVVAPRLGSVLTDLQRLNGLLSPLHPEWGPGGLTNAVLAHLYGRSRLMVGSGARLSPLMALTTKEGLVNAGIDPLGQLVVAPDFDSRILILAFELVDRPHFERWLARLGGPERRRVKLGGELATVVAPQSNRPTTCLARQSYALCQIGVPKRGDPIRPLRRMAAQRGPRLRADGRPHILRRALREMPAGAHVYAAGDSKRLAPRLAALVAEWESRAHRFAEQERRQAALTQAARLRKKIEAAVELTDAVAAGLYPVRGGMEMRWQASLTALGRELLAWWLVPSGQDDDVLVRWSRTPALMRIVARVKPQLLETMAMGLGWSPPKEALTGDVALLSMGLDTLSKLSKEANTEPEIARGAFWSFIFPSAVALGIRSGAHADQVQTGLGQRMKEDERYDWQRRLERDRTRFSGPVAPTRRRLSASFDGSPLQVQVFDRLMIVGMGPGIASAAVRRLGALPQPRRRVGPRSERTFVDVTLYPRAIDAAFEVGNIGPQHRQSLRALEAWRMRWRPLMTRLREVRFAGRLDRDRSRLVVVGRIAE